jgi:perosamine synthetase
MQFGEPMIPLCVPQICGNEWKYVKECIDTGWVSSAGSYVDLFERKFEKYIGATKAVAVVNGTSALHLALHLLGIGRGDEVIVPSMTFVAPVNAVTYTGASPVFVDVCRDTYVMDVEKIELMITARTKAILPVHIYGHPVDMKPLKEIADRHGLYILEDATEALGAEYMEKKLGTIGDIGCFSFNGNKTITTGAGGMLVTNDRTLGKRAKFVSEQSKVELPNKAFTHTEIGYNYRMPNLVAAFGVAQMENLSRFIMKKREHAALYHTLLNDVEGLRLPVEKAWSFHSYWLYSMVVEKEFGIGRDALIDKLGEQGIETRPFFTSVHKFDYYQMCRSSSMEVTEELERGGINLPSSTGIDGTDIEAVCNLIKEFRAKAH